MPTYIVKTSNLKLKQKIKDKIAKGITITHNKITMEMANQLLGVTMHEPGVSRIVTVDIEEAAKLAAI